MKPHFPFHAKNVSVESPNLNQTKNSSLMFTKFISEFNQNLSWKIKFLPVDPCGKQHNAKIYVFNLSWTNQ